MLYNGPLQASSFHGCTSQLPLRHVMDPKRHFKRAGKSKALPRYFQVSNLVTIRQTYSIFFLSSYSVENFMYPPL